MSELSLLSDACSLIVLGLKSEPRQCVNTDGGSDPTNDEASVVAEPSNPTIARVAISKRLRFEVFKRDGFTCQYCGATPPGALLECDHINPVALGGTTDETNLVTACFDCNRGKSDVPLGIVTQTMAERAAEVIEREAQIAGYEAIMRDRRMRIAADAQDVLNYFCEYHTIDGVPQNHFTSMKRFVEHLGLDMCLWAAEIANSMYPRRYKKAFPYFCGICWNKIRERDGR